MFSISGATLFPAFSFPTAHTDPANEFIDQFPEMTIATDTVDKELVEEPHSWDINFIRKFMKVFGFTSLVFDYLTFGIMLADIIEQFRTGWFMNLLFRHQ